MVGQKGHPIHQLDIKTAFLHGEIDEDVFVTALRAWIFVGKIKS